LKTRSIEDHNLVKQFIDGDQKCLDEIIRRYKDKVYTYIFLMVKNQELAEDLFQDTFVKVIKSLKRGKYQDNGKFLSWVLRIAHNLVIDHFRKENQLKVLTNDDYENDLFNSKKLSDITIEETIINKQVTREVRNLVDKLPPEQKEVIVLRHYIGLSFKEIARFSDVSINTALGRMRYALINLRKLMVENKVNLSL
jgi:RNA polymerase sigma-70 factor (ECF subfamily)